MLRTVSVARVSALMETSRGCTTSSSMMLEIPPCGGGGNSVTADGPSHTRPRGRGGGTHLAHVDARHLVSLGVSVAELRYRGDGVQAGVLRQCGGDDLQGVAVGAHAVGLHPAQRARVLGQAHGQLNLRGASAGDQSPGGRSQQVSQRKAPQGAPLSSSLSRPQSVCVCVCV